MMLRIFPEFEESEVRLKTPVPVYATVLKAESDPSGYLAAAMESCIPYRDK